MADTAAGHVTVEVDAPETKSVADGPTGASTGGASDTTAPTPPGQPMAYAKSPAIGDILDAKQPWFSSIGNVSNLSCLIIFVLGVLMLLAFKDNNDWTTHLATYVLSCGLFGLAGGTTNWLAVKMLFDKVPLLYGSGVIPNKFKEIRRTVKDTIMATFFDEAYLQGYVTEHIPKLVAHADLKGRMTTELAKPEVDTMIAQKLAEEVAKGGPNAMILQMAAGFMGGSFEAMAPKLKPLLVAFGIEVVDKITQRVQSGDFLDVRQVRTQIDALMTEKLKLLTPSIVKKLMESVMRKHLGWLIVWGNVFGGVIGIVSQAAGFGVHI